MKHKRLFFVFTLAVCIALATQARAQQDPPTEAQAAPGNRSAAVSFQAPAAESGATITGYTVTASDGTTATGSASPIVVQGLTNGTAYTFKVTATNSLSHTSLPSTISNSVTPSATPLAAYAGTWHESAMITGLGYPYGQKLTQTVNADGTFTVSGDTNNGGSVSENCSAWLFPYGLTATCDQGEPSNLLCYGNKDGTVSVCTGTMGSAAYLSFLTKQGSSYSLSDLSGTWYAEGLDNSTQGDSSEQATATLNGTALSGTVTSSNSPTQSKTIGGTLSLGSDGLLTFNCTSGCGGAGQAEWYVDGGENVAGGFSAYDSGDVELNILTRKAASYSVGDLAGFWAGSELRSDGTWRRLNIEINSDGSYVSAEVKSDGTTGTDFGNLAISADGAVSCAATQPPGSKCSGDLGVLDASKTVLIGTKWTSSGSVYSITIVNKVNSPWANAVDNKGTMELGWFGDFNTTYAPWVYNAKLGWVYPYISETSPADGGWFYDLQWDKGAGGWWYTSQSLFPWVFSYTEKGWFYFIEAASSPSLRLFYDWNTQQYGYR